DEVVVHGVEVGYRGRDPEVDADGGVIGVNVDGGLRLEAFESPGLAEAMFAENVRKRVAQLVRDLQQQRTGESVFEIGRDEAVDMGEVVPDRALQQEPSQ